MRFHSAELSDLRVSHDGMGSFPSSPFRHRVDLVQRLSHKGHHSRYHRFFSQARWCLDTLCCGLAKLLVAVFAHAE